MNEKESKKGRFGRLSLRLFLIALGVFVIAFAVVWWRLPVWLEGYAAKEAQAAGFREVSLHVEHIDPWATTISGVRLINDKTELSLTRLKASFAPAQLWDGVVKEVELSGLRLVVDLQAWLDEAAKPDEVGQSSEETIEDWIQSYMERPVVERVRLLDAILVANIDGKEGEARLNANFVAVIGGLRLDLNGSLEKAPVSAVANFATEGNASVLTTRIWLEDLVPLVETLSSWLENPELKKVSPLAGSGILDLKARLLGDALVSPVLEVNASNLELSAFDQTFRLPKLFLSASERSEDGWNLLATGTAEANATGRAEDWQAEAILDANSSEISLHAGALHTFPPFPRMHFTNLRLPPWRIPYAEPTRLPFGESKILQFEEFTFMEESFIFNLYDGKLTTLFGEDKEFVHLILYPTHANLQLGSASDPSSQQKIEIKNFSYSGAVNYFQDPYLVTPQTVSFKRVDLGLSGSEMKDFVLTFTLSTIRKTLIDSLAMTFDGVKYDLPTPAKLSVEQRPDGSTTLDLNGTTFLLPDLEVRMEGLRAGVRLASVDPLATVGPQELHFDAIRYGDLAITDGRLLFALDANGTFAIHAGEADLLGGTLVFEPTRFDLYGEEIYIVLRLNNVDGSRIASLLKDFDGEITGTFSGRIPLRKVKDQLDFTGGFLELNQSSRGRLRYRSDGLLTEGIQPVGSEYKLRRNTELALKDLAVKRLRLDFVEEDGERKILGQVQGKAQIDKKTTINLDYRPRIHVDLWELLQEIDFETLDLE